ncbi:hypothetical protein [Spirulina major]|uniref:hypothetical protein n=1 Tax=Spirulina major TaxID=270636 RepID=UPI000932F047|nr:hypothetical protein [Spirulina major]
MPTFDPRTLNKHAFEALNQLSTQQSNNDSRRKDQKNQAQELYTYISTWGLIRLKAEEKALNQEGRKEVVVAFFEKLNIISSHTDLVDENPIQTLINLSANEYLGLTGLAIELANEFGFWANAVYSDISGSQ